MKVESLVRINLFPDGAFTQEIEYAPELLALIERERSYAKQILKANLCMAVDGAILRTISNLQNPNYRAANPPPEEEK